MGPNKCNECWRDVSAKADHCPACGAPMGGDGIPRGILHGTVAGLLLLALFVGFLLVRVLLR